MTVTPAPYDHFRTTERADVASGVYRVVGTPGEDVTLLRVTDADGLRQHTGHVERVSVETLAEAFEPAENPGNGGFGSFLRAISAQVLRLFGR